MAKIVEVRNSTAEFLTFVAANKLSASRSQGTQFVIPAYQRNYTFVAANKEEGVQVVYKDETIWAAQQAIAALFDKNKSTISRHIANIYSEGELQPEATVAKFATVVNRGIRGEVVSSNATASSRTACSAATSRKCSWRVANCLSCRWKERRKQMIECAQIRQNAEEKYRNKKYLKNILNRV